MSDLISRSAAIEVLDQHSYETSRDYEKTVELLNEIPALDAVPVVRCKECIHAVAITNLTVANRCGLGQKNCLRSRGDDGFGFSGVSIVYPDGFCDEGARMDGDAE